MQTSKDRVKMIREPRGLLATIVAAIGTAWTSRRAEKSTAQNVQFVQWTGHVGTNSLFYLQVEQRKNRALYYNTRNQLR